MAAKSSRTAIPRAERADHIFAAVLDGRSYAEIALSEGIGLRRVQQIVRETLGERDKVLAIAWRELQIARLQNALGVADAEVNKGKMSAVPAMLRLMRELRPLVERSFHDLPMFYAHDVNCEEFEASRNRLGASREIVKRTATGAAAPQNAAGEGQASAAAPSDIASAAQALDIPQNRATSEISPQ